MEESDDEAFRQFEEVVQEACVTLAIELGHTEPSDDALAAVLRAVIKIREFAERQWGG